MGYLEQLQSKFGDSPVMSAADCAEYLGWDRKRIYHLADRLPFVRKIAGVIVISKKAFAQFLEDLDAPKEIKSEPIVQRNQVTVAPKRAVGRPRGSSKKQPYSQFFIDQLFGAVERKELEVAIDKLKLIQLPEDDKTGNETLESLIGILGKQDSLRDQFELERLLTK